MELENFLAIADEGTPIATLSNEQLTVRLDTPHGVRVARTLAYSLLAAGLDDAALSLLRLVGKE